MIWLHGSAWSDPVEVEGGGGALIVREAIAGELFEALLPVRVWAAPFAWLPNQSLHADTRCTCAALGCGSDLERAACAHNQCAHLALLMPPQQPRVAPPASLLCKLHNSCRCRGQRNKAATAG